MTVDVPALLVAGVLLVAALIAAAVDSPRLPGAAVAVPGAAFLCAVGAVGWPDAEATVRTIAPTVGVLVVVLLLADLAAREGLLTWSAALVARGARPAQGRRPRVAAPSADSAPLRRAVSALTVLLTFAATGLSFLHSTVLMAGPWAVAVLVVLVLRRVRRADLQVPVGPPRRAVPPTPWPALVVLALTVVGAGVAPLVGVSPVWPALAGVVVLAVRQLARRQTRAGDLVTAADLPFALFALGLAVIVLALQRNGLGRLLSTVLPAGDGLPALLGVAAVAAVLAALVTDLPATLALLPVAATSGVPTVLAVLVGVSVGPNPSHLGSLATVAWRRALGARAPSAARSGLVGLVNLVGLVTVPLTVLLATSALWLALRL